MSKTIAFIPVRGGSKSIPLKNIKNFCGKPLVYWNIAALERTSFVDEIVVATDSKEIIDCVNSFNFEKVTIYVRSTKSASDTASTEDVMLEYIAQSQLTDNDIFMLVQATSPLTETKHFEEALSQFNNSAIDSLLTCVRSFRFFWNEDGTSKNYDYKKRPRRQEFDGDLMENGAFYINKVIGIRSSKNRLSGKIGIYEMPEYTAFEIDEPDDWTILESLMKKHVLSISKEKNDIKLFLSDVDGVLTDGGMYYSETGDELKKFNTRDGMGFELLRKAGIKTGIITSEKTKIVENRAKKMKVDFLYQGKREGGKLTAAMEICDKLNITLNQVAYIGDDINCLDLLKAVRIKVCPSDANIVIKNIAQIEVLDCRGGEGCVREMVEKYFLNNG